MKCKFAAVSALSCASGLAQEFDLRGLDRLVEEAQKTTVGLEFKLAGLSGALPELEVLGVMPPLLAQAARPGREDRDYDAGKRALDRNQYDDAIRDFDAVIGAKSVRADGAYYWKAYALNRTGRRGEAMAVIRQLRSEFPQSRWINDAQALEIEINSAEGRPAKPDAENNEELKLMALSAIMQSDPDQAVPIVEKLLKGNQSPQVMDRAMFVLSQSSSPKARQMMLDIARGKGNPDLQFKAVRYISMMGGKESRQDLGAIYASTNDVNLKREIIRSYLMSGSKDELLKAAKGEKNPDLRREAIRVLAQSGGGNELFELYKNESAPEMREEIVKSMLLCGDSTHLAQIAKTEKDPNVRKTAIKTLALTGGGAGETFVEMYRRESDESVKKELVRGLFLQQNAKGLVELARQEKNPEMKKFIVSQLALVHSKETTDYMMEILK